MSWYVWIFVSGVYIGAYRCESKSKAVAVCDNLQSGDLGRRGARYIVTATQPNDPATVEQSP